MRNPFPSNIDTLIKAMKVNDECLFNTHHDDVLAFLEALRDGNSNIHKKARPWHEDIQAAIFSDMSEMPLNINFNSRQNHRAENLSNNEPNVDPFTALIARLRLNGDI